MICPYCGQENPEDLEICGFCGGSLLKATEQPASEVKHTQPVVEVIETSDALQEPQLTPLQPAPPPLGRIYGNKVWWIVGCVVFLCVVLGCVAVVLGINRYTDLFGFLNPATDTPILPTARVAIDIVVPSLSPSTNIIPTMVLNTPAPQISATLFFDDFSDPNSGWDQVDESDYSTNYFADAYRIKVDTDLSDSWANPGDLLFSDGIIEVDATKNGGPDDNDFGLICRYMDTDRYYYAVISSDGYYGISKVTSETTTILGQDNLLYSDLINQGFATNHIRFDCVGNVFTLYVNGQLLDQQTDGEYASGNVGLIAGTYDTPGTDILFDNFSVSAP